MKAIFVFGSCILQYIKCQFLAFVGKRVEMCGVVIVRISGYSI